MLPESENTTVPGDGSAPRAAYQAPPCSTISGTVAIVCTLLISVGDAYSPETAGNGGRDRGWPRLPSSDSRSADSSPQMYAPAPRWIVSETSPSKPARLASESALLS